MPIVKLKNQVKPNGQKSSNKDAVQAMEAMSPGGMDRIVKKKKSRDPAGMALKTSSAGPVRDMDLKANTAPVKGMSLKANVGTSGDVMKAESDGPVSGMSLKAGPSKIGGFTGISSKPGIGGFKAMSTLKNAKKTRTEVVSPGMIKEKGANAVSPDVGEFKVPKNKDGKWAMSGEAMRRKILKRMGK